jgi:hypothetical protein
MAKAVKYIKRNRTTAGRSIGVIVCKVSLPAIEEKYYERLGFRRHETKLTSFVRFVRKILSRADSILEGANLTVDAVIRMKSGGLGRKRLGTWQHGQSVDRFLDDVARAWAALPKEEDWGSQLIEVPDATAPKKKR